MKPMKMLFLVAVLALFALPALAQTKVTGCVVDSLSRNPLKGAAVTLMRGGRTVSFAKTDEKGRFAVAAEAGDSLQVTFLGYAKKRVAAVKGQVLEVQLVQKAFALKEVQVKGLPVFGRQDTTVFDLKRYVSDRDNSLKDVLKKLPGVDVDENGKISFNGKDVSRFTIEDLDLAGGRYNQLNELLKAKDVDRAEVIEHDQPVKALQGKVFTDNVAMNIRLRPEARDKWALTLRPGAVVTTPLEDTRPQGGADALQIGKRRQRMYVAGYDCSGRDLSQNNRLLATGGTEAYDASASVPQWFAAPQLAAPIDAERLRFNRSWEVTVKQTRKSKAGSEQRWTAGYLHTDETQQTGNTSVYYFDGGDPVQTDETDHSRMTSHTIRTPPRRMATSISALNGRAPTVFRRSPTVTETTLGNVWNCRSCTRRTRLRAFSRTKGTRGPYIPRSTSTTLRRKWPLTDGGRSWTICCITPTITSG